MNIKESQEDMRKAYWGGAPGVLASATLWLIAGIVAIYSTQQTSLIVFFFGGMLIFPLGILLSKLLKRSGKHHKENPLSSLAMESTALLFVGLFIAYAVFQASPLWFFPIMLMIIGSRYLVFQSIYGMKVYWILGAVLCAAGIFTLLTNVPFHIGALAGGTIELIFSILILNMERVKT